VGFGDFYLFAPPYIWDSVIEMLRAVIQSGCGKSKYFVKCIFGVKVV
jgi:hypothetical protein